MSEWRISPFSDCLPFPDGFSRLLTSLFRASMPESPVNAVCGVQLRYKPFTGARWKYIYSDDDSCAGIAHRAGSGVRAAFLIRAQRVGSRVKWNLGDKWFAISGKNSLSDVIVNPARGRLP